MADYFEIISPKKGKKTNRQWPVSGGKNLPKAKQPKPKAKRGGK